MYVYYKSKRMNLLSVEYKNGKLLINFFPKSLTIKNHAVIGYAYKKVLPKNGQYNTE